MVRSSANWVPVHNNNRKHVATFVHKTLGRGFKVAMYCTDIIELE